MIRTFFTLIMLSLGLASSSVMACAENLIGPHNSLNIFNSNAPFSRQKFSEKYHLPANFWQLPFPEQLHATDEFFAGGKFGALDVEDALNLGNYFIDRLIEQWPSTSMATEVELKILDHASLLKYLTTDAESLTYGKSNFHPRVRAVLFQVKEAVMLPQTPFAQYLRQELQGLKNPLHLIFDPQNMLFTSSQGCLQFPFGNSLPSILIGPSCLKFILDANDLTDLLQESTLAHETFHGKHQDMIAQGKRSLLAGTIYSAEHRPEDLRLLFDLPYINTPQFSVDEVVAHAISLKYTLLALRKIWDQKDNPDREKILTHARSSAIFLHGHIMGALKVVDQIVADGKKMNFGPGRLKNSRGDVREFMVITAAVHDQDLDGREVITKYNYFLPLNLLPDQKFPSSPRNQKFIRSYFEQQLAYLGDRYSAACHIFDEVAEKDITDQNINQLLLWAAEIADRPVPLWVQP